MVCIFLPVIVIGIPPEVTAYQCFFTFIILAFFVFAFYFLLCSGPVVGCENPV